jgi:uncharacterized protein (DUF2267 family)
MSELVIDESNFGEYFRDCRTSKPERGDIMARYMARAEFIDGQMKKDVIDLLSNRDKAYAATQVMRKLGCATQPEAVRICKEICQDLASGMTPEEVERKSYEYDMEVFYYTKKEHIPIDDPRWTPIGIANLDEFLDRANQKLKMTARIVVPDGAEADVEDNE